MVQNKWNGRFYEVVEDNGVTVTLKKCSDKTIFKIAKSEFTFSYKSLNKKAAVEK